MTQGQFMGTQGLLVCVGKWRLKGEKLGQRRLLKKDKKPNQPPTRPSAPNPKKTPEENSGRTLQLMNPSFRINPGRTLEHFSPVKMDRIRAESAAIGCRCRWKQVGDVSKFTGYPPASCPSLRQPGSGESTSFPLCKDVLRYKQQSQAQSIVVFNPEQGEVMTCVLIPDVHTDVLYS